jgi:hypothetical protein
MKINAQISAICFYAAKSSRCSMPAPDLLPRMIEAGKRLDARLAARATFTSAQKHDILCEAQGGSNARTDNES